MDQILDSLLDDFIYERILQQSMESHLQELFKKTCNYCVTIPKQKMEKPDMSCFICLDKIGKDESVYHLPCGHYFHSSCLDESVSHQHLLCPTCRQPIPIRNRDEHTITYHES